MSEPDTIDRPNEGKAMSIEIHWQDDCQGKKDYDAGIVEISSRLYPRGGGYWLLSSDGRIEDNDARPQIKPSATSSVLLGREVLATQSFEGESEAEVMAQVEQWAALQISKIEAAVRAAFNA